MEKKRYLFTITRDPGQSSIEKGRNLTLVQEGKDPDFRCSVETTGSLEVSSDDIRDYVSIIFRTTLSKAKEIEDKLIIGKTVEVYGHFHDGRKSAFLGDMLFAEEITNFDFKIEKISSTKKRKIGHENVIVFPGLNGGP